MSQTQNFANHSKMVPMFHYVVLPILGVNLISSIFGLVRSIRPQQLFRGMPSSVSRRGRSRSPRPLRPHVRASRSGSRHPSRCSCVSRTCSPPTCVHASPEFTVSQLVALRFASDAELPDLARKTLAENLRERKAIKQLIRDWQPDNLRA